MRADILTRVFVALLPSIPRLTRILMGSCTCLRVCKRKAPAFTAEYGLFEKQ